MGFPLRRRDRHGQVSLSHCSLPPNSEPHRVFFAFPARGRCLCRSTGERRAGGARQVPPSPAASCRWLYLDRFSHDDIVHIICLSDITEIFFSPAGKRLYRPAAPACKRVTGEGLVRQPERSRKGGGRLRAWPPSRIGSPSQRARPEPFSTRHKWHTPWAPSPSPARHPF